ncbi:hypothetical protein F4803DRAFT_503850 [Xylaria telfairii]|nr:hypothetical protein F4803DRAFT_503850 [Xylaria telfairii]
MNRLCQSSYGSLEAVIGISGYNGDAQCKLVHFSRDRMTGQWSASAVVSSHPKSGGSMIQSISKHHADQEHGDFEVVVLEENGTLQHYTRDNTPAEKGAYAWRLSATVTAASESKPPVTAIYAAPLIQSQLSTDDDSDGTTLETIVVDKNRKAIHYRCAQYGTSNKSVEHRHQWREGKMISDAATGPACFYKTSSGLLTALVPSVDGVRRYHFRSTDWTFVDKFAPNGVPNGVYTTLMSGTTTFHAFVRAGYEIHDYLHQAKVWKTSTSPLPASLSRIIYTPYHRVNSTNPISILFQPANTVGQSHNTEAICFHACGTGFQDAWMILHWSLLAGTDKWFVSDIVLPRVIGMPM